jgi:DNA polymerase-3 subunit alpha
LEKDGQIVNVISDTYWDAIYSREMDKPRTYIKQHHDELLEKMNHNLFHDEFMKYGEGDKLQWELDSLSFYYSGHPLANVVLPVETTALSDLKEDDFDGFWMIKGKRVPKYHLSTIIGTVIDKDKQHGFFTLQTADGGAIEVKVFKQQFAHYTHVISEVNAEGEKDILEDSFFEKGTHLVVTGIKRGEIFIPKVYKNTGFDAILKAVLNDQGQVDYLVRKSGGADAN